MNDKEYRILLERCQKQLESLLVEVRAALRTPKSVELDHSESKEKWIEGSTFKYYHIQNWKKMEQERDEFY